MSNPMLTWYRSDILDEIAKRIALDPAYETAADLALRDDHGVWWRPQRDGSWVCHGSNAWERARCPATLEGVTPLPTGISAPLPEVDDLDEREPAGDPATALEHFVDRIGELYRSGAMVSTMAELTLSDGRLLTADGTLWTVSAQSRSWYSYGNDGWERGEGRPDGPFLSGDQARHAAKADDGPMQRWAEAGPLLPEAITADWAVPAPPEAFVEGEAPDGPAPAPPPSPLVAEGWIASHIVPSEGLQTGAHPDPSRAVVAELAGGPEVPAADTSRPGAGVADAVPLGSGTPAEQSDEAEWGYVLDPVDVRGVTDTATVVGRLQPGTWYLMTSAAGDWVRVADPDGPLQGWAPAARVHRQSDPPPVTPAQPEAAAAPAPTTTPELVATSAPSWSATHNVPAEGLQARALPDPAGEVIATLAGGVELHVVERRADWAHIEAENGWKAWVDGRRLLIADTASDPPADPPASAAAGSPTLETMANDALTATGTNSVSLIAAIVLLLSAFLPWFREPWGEGALGSFATSIFHVWNGSYNAGLLTIGLVVLIVGAAAVATLFVDQAARYRRLVGAIAVVIAAVWLILTLGYLWGQSFEPIRMALGALLTQSFALGPWVALAAGITLLVKRRPMGTRPPGPR